MNNSDQRSAFRLVRLLVPVAILIVGLGLTVFVWYQQVDFRASDLRANFENRVHDAVSHVRARLSHYEQGLLDTRALIQSTDPLTHSVFSAFVADSDVPGRFPGIQGIGFSQVVSRAGQDGAELLRSAIVYLEPSNARNLRALGFDMYAEPVRRRAMSRAADTGESALSGKVRLVQETDTDEQAGFLVYVPVYEKNVRLVTVDDRRQNLKGWVYAPFRMNDFLTGILGEAGADLDLEVFDGRGTSPETLMFDRVPDNHVATNKLLMASLELEFAGHAWTLLVGGLPSLAALQGPDLSGVVMGLGIVISALLALLGWVLIQQVGRVRELNASLEADVKERTQALKQKQQRLAAIINGTNVGTWEWNVQTGETVFDERWAQIVGATLEELKPISIQTWVDFGHPDDLKVSEDLLQRHFRGELENYEFECRMRHKDGHWVWVLDRGAVATWTPDGKPEWMFGTHAEITERKNWEASLRASEEKFSTLFQLLPVGVVLTDGNDRIVESNQVAREVLGEAPWSLIRPDGKPMATEERPSVLAIRENRTQSDVEIGVQRADGEVRWLLVSSSPIPVSGLGVCVVFTDITDRKRADALRAELEVQNQQLKKGQSLAQMAGALAHLFNNKLQSVRSALDLLKFLRNDATTARPLARAEASVVSASEVSRLLLAYLGQSSLDREPLLLGPVVSNGFESFAKSLAAKVRLSRDISSNDLVVNANAEQMRQILSQLLMNALEALNDGDGSISLLVDECEASDISSEHRFPLAWQPEAQNYARVQVHDTGSGIDPADFERLFDPFFTTKFTGRGLGLAVILGIVKAHGGSITVESRLGLGSSFRVYLPIVAEGDRPVATSPTEIPETSGRKVLLVDDEPQLLDSVGELIEMLGFPVLTAIDGIEALKLFQEHRSEIRCVLTDLTMPNLDGWGLLKALRQIDPGLPVVLASGYDKAQVLSGEHDELPTDYVSKPFELDQLQRVLGTATTLRS